MIEEPGDNLEWLSLVGPHTAFAMGTDTARRYITGFPPVAGFASSKKPDFAALVPFCKVGEQLYCRTWIGSTPKGWHMHAELLLSLMKWDGPAPKQPDGVTQLTPDDVPQMLDLVALTRPGPFGPRNLELGAHFGVFEDGRLIAMAGQRFQGASWRETTCVCTHPNYTGRGLGRRVTEQVVSYQLRHGQVPCLHVDHENASARRLYDQMGFVPHAEVGVRVMSRIS